MASSKSRACSPSIVTVVTGRKSVRPRMSRSLTAPPSRCASSIDSSECASGMPCLRMMICVSTPGSSMRPSTSTTRPTGPRVAVGHRVISTSTISPGSADDRLPRRHLDVGQHAAVERHDVAETGIVDLEAADDGLLAALEDADDASLEPLLGLALDARHDAVAVHRLGQVRRRDVDVLALARLGVLGHDEAEAAGIGLQPARPRRPSSRRRRSDCRESGAARRSRRAS